MTDIPIQNRVREMGWVVDHQCVGTVTSESAGEGGGSHSIHEPQLEVWDVFDGFRPQSFDLIINNIKRARRHQRPR